MLVYRHGGGHKASHLAWREDPRGAACPLAYRRVWSPDCSLGVPQERSSCALPTASRPRRAQCAVRCRACFRTLALGHGAAEGGGHDSVVDIQRVHHRDSISRGRTMPSFTILETSVLRFRPKRAAAPWGPATTQFVACIASRICARIASSSVADCGTTGAVLPGPGLLAGTCGHRTPWADRITARSMTCCNSRTLPGQS